MHYQVSSTYKYSINFLKKNLLVTNIQSPNKHGTLSLPEYIIHYGSASIQLSGRGGLMLDVNTITIIKRTDLFVNITK